MKTYTISSGSIKSEIILPRSKSYANRVLILAALSQHETIIEHLPEVDDVKYLLSALIKVGILNKKKDNKNYLFGAFPLCVTGPTPIVLDIGEGGTTARFLTALLSLDHHEYHLILSGKLSERPWDELISSLEQLGAEISLKNNLLKIKGPVRFTDKSIKVSAKRSTQFASALKLAFSHYVDVIPENLMASLSYWKLTELLVEKFKTSHYFTIPIDWSGASYPMCFAALTEEVFFPGLHYDAYQADAKLFDVLNRLDAIKNSTEEGITVKPIFNRSQSVKLDVSDCLDLVPALCFLLSHIEGTHELCGVKNLIHKESDRLQEVMNLMNSFSRINSHDSLKDTLTIQGHQKKILDSLDIQTAPDHRMVMTASLFLKYHSGGSVEHPEAVDKSFLSFFKVCGV